jgi:hypothetical protein
VRTQPPNELTGAPGELVQRLIYLLDQEPPCDPLWTQNLGWPAGIKFDVSPDRDESSESFLRRYIHHLNAILRLGVDEALIVSAARAQMDKWVNERADDMHKANQERSKFRAFLTETLEDPLGIDRHREKHPDDTRSDDEIRASLRRTIDFMQPISAEDATRNWAVQEHYQAEVAQWLSDDVISEWEELRLRRIIRRHRGDA